MSVTVDSVIRQDPNSLAAAIDGEVVMMSVQTGKYYVLDEVGSFIWNKAAQPIAISALCDAIEAEFDVDRGRCERDALAFLKGLADDGLVQRVD